MGKIELLEDGENNTFIIQGFKGGENWYLVGWNKEEQDRPEKCFFDNCLCICKPEDATSNNPYGRKQYGRQDLGEGCQDNGFCREIESPSIAVASRVFISSGVPPAGDTLYPSCISFSKSANEILIMKKKPLESELWKFGGYSADLMIFNEEFSAKVSCIDLPRQAADEAQSEAFRGLTN